MFDEALLAKMLAYVASHGMTLEDLPG